MGTLKETILKNYKKSSQKFIQDNLVKYGFLKTPNNEIIKLDVFNDGFTIVNIEDIINIIDANTGNLWNIPTDMQDKIITDILVELLPVASTSEIENYYKYLNIESKIIDQKQLDDQVEKLLKQNIRRHKKVFKGRNQAPEYQAQILINNDVIYCKSSNGYYVFDADRMRFTKLSAAAILEYIKKEFKNLNITDIDVMEYMTNNYLFFVTQSNLPNTYNKNKEYLHSLDIYKNDFDKINNITSNFN